MDGKQLSLLALQAMVRGIVQLAGTLLTNAILPEAVSSEMRTQYQNRLARWPVASRDDTMYLMQSLKTLR